VFTPSQISQLQEKLAESKKIAICTHLNPDGDAIGSSLALKLYFTNQGFNVNCVIPNNIPDFYKWLPEAETIVNAHKDLKEARKVIEEADILFLTDMNDEERSGTELHNTLLGARAYKVLIDHHPNPTAKCDFIYSDIHTTSACENVYRFLSEISIKPFLTKDIGTCIYTGIITDTGSFSYGCNDPKTYLIVAKLLEIGINGEAIHRKVYDNYLESRIRLLGICLNKLKIFPHLGTSYSYITQKDIKECKFQEGDTEGFVNYGISLKGIYFTAFFTEREKRIRVSFRSKGSFDVNKFAKTYFKGGGHRNAAASFHYDTLENTIKYFEEVIQNHPELNK
jgi:phosphoesterase RecJ-like protein